MSAPGPRDDDAADAHLREQRLGSQTLLQGGFLEIRRDDVRLPDGRTTTREYVRHGGAVAVVAVHDDGRLVVVRQYRYPLAKVLLEIPAGKRDRGEKQIDCAVRELREETGFAAAEWAYGGEIHNAAAYSTESIWLWFARGLQPGAAQLDDGEFVETLAMAVDELDALDAADRLPDAKTVVGLHWWRQVLAGRRLCRWHSAADALASPDPGPPPAEPR